MAEKIDLKNLPSFKGKPIARNGNTIYYGDPSEEYVAMLQVQSNKPLNDVSLSEKISVTIMKTDESIDIIKRIMRTTEKVGLYNALNIASIWLDRAKNGSLN